MFADLKTVLSEALRMWKRIRANRARRAALPDPFN